MHVERTGSITLPAPPERTFQLFTPEGERLWVPGWAPEKLHTPDADLNVEGAVFRTTATGEETLWIVLNLDRKSGSADYARVTPGSRLGTVHIRCARTAGDDTSVEVTYRLTSISPAGETVLEALTNEAYQEMLADWQEKTAGVLGD